MNVSRWMTKSPITCRPEHSLAHAASLCWEHDLGALPVTDTEGKLVWMITDRDLCMAAFTRGATLGDHTVASAMATKLYTLAPKDSLKKAQATLRTHQLRRLPVVDAKGALVGVLTLQDLARKTFELPRTKRKSAAIQVAETLARVSAPRPRVVPAVPPPSAATATTSTSSDGAGVLAPKKSSKKSAAKSPASSSARKPARKSARRVLAKSR